MRMCAAGREEDGSVDASDAGNSRVVTCITRTDLVLSSAITESSSPSTNTSTLTWITWFCSLPGHEYFCEVAEVSSSSLEGIQEY